MFGSYQAGVWSELASVWQPDIVVGASVGSLNAYLIASGCPPDEIERRWLTLNSRPSWKLPLRPTEGIIDDSELAALIEQVCHDWHPKIPLGVVATRLRTLTPELFQGEIGCRHLGASCAVPFFLRLHQLDGAVYADGGLLDPLPLWAAVQMGAMRIVAVNVMEHRPRAIRAVVKGLNCLSPFKAQLPKDHEVIRIAPSSALGPASESIFWEGDRAARWIQAGREDARKLKHLVVECFEHK